MFHFFSARVRGRGIPGQPGGGRSVFEIPGERGVGVFPGGGVRRGREGVCRKFSGGGGCSGPKFPPSVDTDTDTDTRYRLETLFRLIHSWSVLALLCMWCSDYRHNTDTEFDCASITSATNIQVQMWILWAWIPCLSFGCHCICCKPQIPGFPVYRQEKDHMQFFQGQILAVWILAAKLPNSDLDFALDFLVAFSSCFSELFEMGPVQFSRPRGVAEIGLLNRDLGNILSIFPGKTAKHRVH